MLPIVNKQQIHIGILSILTKISRDSDMTVVWYFTAVIFRHSGKFETPWRVWIFQKRFYHYFSSKNMQYITKRSLTWYFQNY